jgi:HK97 family phage major capsid protein
MEKIENQNQAELLEKQKQEALKNIKKTAEEAAQGKAQEIVNEKLNEVVSKFDNVSTKEEAEKLKTEFNKSVQELQAKLKELKQTHGEVKQKSFNENLAEAIQENAEKIRGYASTKGNFSEVITLKAVGDMSIANNFPGATPWIQEAQQGLILNPYNRVWLADLLPSATSTANSVIYPKENGGEGAVAFWDKTGNKAQVDYDLTSQSAFFKWIAGYVIVEREMLDDISWLTGYLQSKLLIGLKTAENSLILDGTSDSTTNPVIGLIASATAYDGEYTALLDMIIDAAYGQIPEKTNDFYVPTNVVLHPRDIVKVGLNKATGSGEYDLPMGSVAFANGRLSISGLDTVGTTSIDKDDFLTFDRNAAMFLRRMNPEIRMFEDATLAKANKVMFRIEERVSLAIFNNNAIVKGTATT